MPPSPAGPRGRNRFRIAAAAETTRAALVTSRRRRRAWAACRVTQMVAICTNRTSDTAHVAVIVADSP
jgi:hypothetical protein